MSALRIVGVSTHTDRGLRAAMASAVRFALFRLAHIAGLASITAVACTAPAAVPTNVVAYVDDVAITADAVSARVASVLARHRATGSEAGTAIVDSVHQQAVDRLIDRVLVRRAAYAHGIAPSGADRADMDRRVAALTALVAGSDDVQSLSTSPALLAEEVRAELVDVSLRARLRDYLSRSAQAAKPDDAAMRRYYGAHAGEFTTAPAVRVARTTVSPRTRASADVGVTPATCDELDADLPPSASEPRQGDESWVYEGDVDHALFATLVSLPIGNRTCGAVEADGSVTLYQVRARRVAQLAPYESVAARVRSSVRAQAARVAWTSAMSEVRASAQIRRVDHQNRSEPTAAAAKEQR